MKELAAWIVALGPAGLFLAAFIDGAGVPFPGGVDVLIIFLAMQTPGQVIWLSFLAVTGSVLGNFLLYYLARRGGQAYLERRASKRSTRFRHWFDKYGLLTVFISALVPLPVMPMKIFVLCSGALGSKPGSFLLAFTGARIPRYLGLAYLGSRMGNDAVGYIKSHAWHLAVFAVVLFLMLVAIVKIADRTSKRVRVPAPE